MLGVPIVDNVTGLQFALSVIHAIPSPIVYKWLCTETMDTRILNTEACNEQLLWPVNRMPLPQIQKLCLFSEKQNAVGLLIRFDWTVISKFYSWSNLWGSNFGQEDRPTKYKCVFVFLLKKRFEHIYKNPTVITKSG
jgi:hypothetical protein